MVTKTNISRTKAEQAVETVFESLKTALGRGQRIELRRFGVFSVKPARPASAATRALGRSQHPSGKSRALQTRQGIAGPGRHEASLSRLIKLLSRRLLLSRGFNRLSIALTRLVSFPGLAALP